jgi:hypothetical protein
MASCFSSTSPILSCPPSKARTIDRPNDFQIRGWQHWLHFDAEGERLEGAVLDGGELRIEDEARLRGAVHGHDIAGHGGEVGEEGAEAVDRQAVVGAALRALRWAASERSALATTEGRAESAAALS